MQLKSILYTFIVFVSFNSCSFLDNDSYNPAYLVFDEAIITTKTGEGDPIANIKSVWVYADGQLLGIFPIPGKVPIIPTGSEMEILISAGVNENADLSSGIEYPFFNRIILNRNFSQGQELNVDLNFTYKSDLKFDIVEGFESSFQVFTKDIDGNSETRISNTTIDKVSGARSGIVTLNNSNRDFEVTTENYFNNNLNLKGSVFLEFDYKCDENILVGTEILQNQLLTTAYKVILVQTDDWKRAYINLTDEISDPNTALYKVILGAGYESTNGEDSELYFDNIKLIHF